jgi:hypothetical protein
MLRSFSGQLDAVHSFLEKNGKDDLAPPDYVTEEALERLVTFFAVFDKGIKALEGDLQPTLQNVLPVYEGLLNHCKDHFEDEQLGGVARKFYDLIPVSCPHFS